MANTAQSKKRARQNDKRRARNASQRSKMRTHVKNVVKLIEKKEASKSRDAYPVMVSEVDKLVSKGLIHKNKAARYKQRLNARIKALQA